MLISEIAKRAGMSKDGVRHYEELGLISSTPRRAGSKIYRDYDAAALEKIELVKQAQQLGYTLKEIGPLLQAFATRQLTREQTIEFLEARLHAIRERTTELQRVEAFILGKIAHYREGQTPPPC